ncbi:MAG: DUF3810 family protein [Acidobacteriota bacterium]
MATWWRFVLISVAAVTAIVPLSPRWVERAYSTSLYRTVQRLLTTCSNLVPFALFDLLIVVAICAWVGAAVVDLRGGRPWRRFVGRFLLRTAVMTATFYIAFLLLWGLNYRRVRLSEKLQIDEASISPDSASVAMATAIEQLNALHVRAHDKGWAPLSVIDPDLVDAFARADRDLGGRTPPVAARPKVTFFDLYFRRVGVEGMTDPYFLETLVQRELLPFERPFVIAHEWSHLAGFADESEANFVGWLTCLRGSVADQYSGWLFLYAELSRAVRARDRGPLAATLAAGPRADLNAIADRYNRQVNPRMSVTGWRVYDRYLKANRVAAGTASYDQVVRLVLGARFGPDWTPLLR